MLAIGCVLGLALALGPGAWPVAAAQADREAAAGTVQEIEQLKARLAEQQRQIEDLRAAFEAERTLKEHHAPAPAAPHVGEAPEPRIS